MCIVIRYATNVHCKLYYTTQSMQYAWLFNVHSCTIFVCFSIFFSSVSSGDFKSKSISIETTLEFCDSISMLQQKGNATNHFHNLHKSIESFADRIRLPIVHNCSKKAYQKQCVRNSIDRAFMCSRQFSFRTRYITLFAAQSNQLRYIQWI